MEPAPATQDMPINPVHRRDWIGYQLRLRNLSFRAIARQEGVSHQAVCAAARGSSSRPLQEALAAALGLTPQALFPELYDEAGQRLGSTRAPQRSTPPAAATCPLSPPATLPEAALPYTRIEESVFRHATS
ncbi:hypothetical protein F1188_17740 [Roseospira marina]|uniref:Ner winged helix-turn-helix DNA-binding domain-containing protein n=2 Tax=Roseospira marina TaxID=140057 RepID=A0A5M6I702_9PROT|nr:hypothetical protein F1188_17740 [Roseospira marina]